MADMPHYCSACGEPHGGPSGDSEAVRIAKIEAERDIEVARLARSEARQEIEAETEQATIAAEAAVAEAVVEAAVLEDVVMPAEPELAEPDPEPTDIPVVVPDVAESPEDTPPPPETGDTKPRESKGGYWAGYSAS